MAKKTITIDLPTFAGALGLMKGAGFEVDVIAQYLFDEIRGTASHDLPNALLTEFEDAVMSFMDDPVDTALDTGMGYLKARIPFKLLGMGLEAFGLKKAVKIGRIRVKYAG